MSTKRNLYPEHLHYFNKMTAKQKLQWLEEAKKFVDSLPEKIKKLHEKSRKGEI